jgi:hypothetical protein
MGELIFIDKEGSILTERPVVTVSEEKDKVLATFSDQKKRRDSLSHDLKINKIDKETVKNFISEINEHFVQSINEWKDYLESLDEGIGLKIQDHMPIYYCSKLWNALVKDQN